MGKFLDSWRLKQYNDVTKLYLPSDGFKGLSLDWLIQNNNDVMILIFDQQREYYANLPISNGVRKN